MFDAWNTHYIPLILTLRLKVAIKKTFSSEEEPPGHFWCLLICRTSGPGQITAPTRLPLVKQMRHSLDWWSDWSPGCSEFFPLAGTAVFPADASIRAVPRRVTSGVCASAFVSTPVPLRLLQSAFAQWLTEVNPKGATESVSQATREPIRALWTSLSKTLSGAVHHRAAGHG